MDLSALDRPEILETLFPMAYSPSLFMNFLQPEPPSIPYRAIEVEDGVTIQCGFWASSKNSPAILYFHGNGETVANHHWIALLYKQKRLNLFVADYRGYGDSDGKPTISNMVSDAHTLFDGFKEIIEKEGFKQSLFVMGRSLGSIPAVEIAFTHQEEIRGLIIESGTASNFKGMGRILGIEENERIYGKDSLFLNKNKLSRTSTPTLIIHGELDQIIPVSEGKELYEFSASDDKKLLIIPEANHNDIMMADQNLYFNTIEEFAGRYG